MSKEPPKKPQKQVRQIEVPADLEATYINVVMITHTVAEFVLDVSQILPGTNPAQVKHRLLMSPLSAKLFHKALTENIAKYEANYGEIKLPGAGTSLAEHLFRPPQK